MSAVARVRVEEDTTLSDVAGETLQRILVAAGAPLGLQIEGQHVLSEMLTPWGERPVGFEPAFASDITDDHSPFEFSLGLHEGKVKVRFLVEAQADVMDGPGAWDAGLALTERCARGDMEKLKLFRQVSDLFVPPSGSQPRFSLWNAVVLTSDGEHLFKAYLNPRAQGREPAVVVEEALKTLGLESAWEKLHRLLESGENEVCYFSVDLAAPEDARIKVYVAHRNAHAAGMERQLSKLSRYHPGDVTRLAIAMTEREGPFRDRPFLTCLSFRTDGELFRLTHHLPVRCYVDSDAAVAARIPRLFGGDSNTANQVVRALSRVPLQQSTGIVTYVSSSRYKDSHNYVLYLSPKLYSAVDEQAVASEAAPSRAPADSVVAPNESMVVPSMPRPETHIGPAALAINDHVRRHQADLRASDLVQLLEGGTSSESARLVAKGLAFFALSAHDIVRQCRSYLKNASVCQSVSRYLVNDVGYVDAVAADLHDLSVEATVPWLFSPYQLASRKASFSLMSEAARAGDDAGLIAVMVSLESSLELLLGVVGSSLQRSGEVERLRRFAPPGSAPIRTATLMESLEWPEVSPANLEEAFRIVDRCFAVVHQMNGALLEQCRSGSTAMTA